MLRRWARLIASVLRFVVLVHFAVVPFLDLWFARFRKTTGASIFGCLLFLANSPFWASICGEKSNWSGLFDKKKPSQDFG